MDHFQSWGRATSPAFTRILEEQFEIGEFVWAKRKRPRHTNGLGGKGGPSWGQRSKMARVLRRGRYGFRGF